ncbi:MULTISPECIES: MOSC domain-containing protein [unclassified Paenibacillus]|uniref:MOSC domain-containing protein n=1 Tax=unclassified Paenibacillus TaxID=185978 RepID=UPI00070B7A53|nr:MULTISPECIES: MOSC domain-containing protein [unclassified Paenibacillus]KQX66924.1 molybdenum cofactor sulfurase [Paenibacillus sp. Root444D2]KRE47506.1 molybdenum cofactor sulfurase [Paenibacillus sp. Soil724D2]
MAIIAKIEAVLIADDASTFVTREIDGVELSFGGIEGDRHFGLFAKADSRQPMYKRGQEIMNRRQLSIVSVEELQGIAQRLGVETIKPEWLGANIVVSGAPELTKLPMGIRMILPSGGGLVCEGENEPCAGPGKQIANYYGDRSLTQQFIKHAGQSRGIVAYVERPGELKPGDLVEIQI